MSKKIILGNWKMNPRSLKEAEKLFNDGVNNTSDWTWSCTGTDNIPVSCTMLKPKPVFKEN